MQIWPAGQDAALQQTPLTQFPDAHRLGLEHGAPFAAGVGVEVAVGVRVAVGVQLGVGVGVGRLAQYPREPARLQA